MTHSLTSELLVNKYPALISQTEIAEIFGQHVQTVRRLARAGLLPFPNVSIARQEKKYKLEDVINYLEHPPTPAAQVTKRRGRPVGSRNKEMHVPQ